MNSVGEQTVDMCGGAGLVTGNPTQHQTWHWTCAAAGAGQGWPGHHHRYWLCGQSVVTVIGR